MRLPLLALALTVAGCIAVAAATAGDPLPPIESIPLPAAAIATPVDTRITPPIASPASARFASTTGKPPPIRSTPMFAPVDNRRVSLLPWHKRTLMGFYLPPQPTPDMGMT